MRLLCLGLIFTSLAVHALPQDVSSPVVYGTDDRIEVYQASAALQEVARSSAVKFSKSLLGAGNLLPNETLATGEGICLSERFAQQPHTGLCSGFLVGPDLLVTAGHCANDQTDCDDSLWVFDHQLDPISLEAPLIASPRRTYQCKKIISHANDMASNADYALIQLDRVVEGRRPLPYRSEGKLADGTELAMIGNPSGLPTKVVEHGQLNDNSPSNFFTVAIDSFSGNSGGMVLDARTLTVEGLLVRGDEDYTYDPERNCRVVNVCPVEGCDPGQDEKGEDATRITEILELRERTNVLTAASRGDFDLVQGYLFDGGWADLYDNQKVSIAMKAADGGQGRILLLLQSRIDLAAKDLQGRTLLHHLGLAQHRWSESDREWLGQMVRGLALNVQDQSGNSALHLAVQSGNSVLTEVLLAAGAQSQLNNNDGKSPRELCQDREMKRRKICDRL